MFEVSFVVFRNRLLLCLALILLCGEARGAEFATGRDFHRQLKGNKIGITWAANPIRDALSKLSSTQQLAIHLDRRVPPDLQLNYRTEPKPLVESLDELAAFKELGWSTLGPMVVIGPKAPAIRLPSLAAIQRAQVGKLPASRRAALLKARPLEWRRLARPREVVGRLAEEAGVRITNLDDVPHDLWPASELPALPWIDRATLVLNSFDLILKLDESGRTASVVPLPAVKPFQRTHGTPAGVRVDYAALKRAFPGAKVMKVGTGYRATGSFQQHDEIAKWLLRESTLVAGRRPPARPPNGRPVTRPTQVYDLRIDNQPVGGVLNAVCKKLGWTPRVSDAASRRLNKLISFEVKQATQDQLLDAAVKPAGLKYRINGNVLEISTVDE